MAFIDTFAKYHTMSKYPLDENTSLANVRNKSGHTVTTGDIWSSEIPAFFVVYDTDSRDSLPASEGDLCKLNGEIFKYTNGAWVAREALADGEEIGGVIKYHKGCKAVILTDTNNSGTGGNGYSVRFRPNSGDENTPFIPAFISSMDKVVEGRPSVGYDPVIHDTTSETGFCNEGVGTNEFIANCYGGVITFNTRRNQVDSAGKPTGNHAEISITIDCFEYIGKRLNTTVDELAKAIYGEGGEGGEDQSLTQRVAANTTAISTLNGSVTTQGSVKHTINSVLSGLDSTSNGGNGISVIQTDGLVATTVTTATVEESGAISANPGNVVTATGAQNIAKAAATAAITDAIGEGSAITEEVQSQITDATLGANETIAETTETTKLVTVEDVKTYVENNAQVTLNAGNGIDIGGEGKGTEFTISVDTSVIATKASVDAITTSLTTGDIATAISNAQSAADAAQGDATKALADAATAQGTANTAVTNAATAQAAANAAQGDATKALADAAAAKSAADAAQGTANQGVTDAAAAKSAADAAQTTANQGVTDAAAAKSAADAAQTTANQGVSDAAAALAEAQAKVASVTVTDTTGTITSVGTATEPAFTVTAGTIEEGKLVTGTTVKAHVAAEIAKVNGAADTLAGRVTTAEGKIKTLEETTVPAIQKSITDLKAVSLAKSSADGLVKVSTTGTVGTGIESISVEVSDTVAKTTDTLSATSTGSDNVQVVLGGTIAEPTLTVTGTDIASAQALATLTQTVNTHITEAAGLYLSVEKVDALPEGDDRKTNKIYLLPLNTEAGREQNIHTEYIWTGSAWEIIGTTAIDISSLEAAAKAAQDAADAAQGDVDTLEGVVTTLSGTVDSNKTATDAAIATTNAAVATLEGKVTTLEGKVSTLESEVAALTTGDNSVAKQIEAVQSDIDGVSDRVTELEETTVPAALKAAQDAQTTANKGVTDAAAAKTAADAAQGDATKALADAAAAQGDATQALADAADAQGAADAAQGAADAAQKDATQALTDAATAQATADAAQAAADSKIASVVNSTTHLGSDLATTEGTTVTIAPATRWNASEVTVPVAVVEVINGEMFNSAGELIGTIDDANLVNGTSMFAGEGKLNLKKYVGDLGKLTTGTNMFNGCANLTTFCGDLGSLTEGTGMFAGCQLDEESLIYIVDSLPTVSGKTITVGVAAGVNKAPYVTEATKKGWTLA